MARDLSQVELPPVLKPGLVQLPLRVQPTAAQPNVDATAYREAETLLLQVRLDSRLGQSILKCYFLHLHGRLSELHCILSPHFFKGKCFLSPPTVNPPDG